MLSRCAEMVHIICEEMCMFTSYHQNQRLQLTMLSMGDSMLRSRLMHVITYSFGHCKEPMNLILFETCAFPCNYKVYHKGLSISTKMI